MLVYIFSTHKWLNLEINKNSYTHTQKPSQFCNSLPIFLDTNFTQLTQTEKGRGNNNKTVNNYLWFFCVPGITLNALLLLTLTMTIGSKYHYPAPPLYRGRNWSVPEYNPIPKFKVLTTGMLSQENCKGAEEGKIMENGRVGEGRWEAKENLLPRHMGSYPHGHWRVRSTVPYSLSTNCPDVQPGDGSDRWKRLFFNPEPLDAGCRHLLWGSAGKPGGVVPQRLRENERVKVSWLMSWREASLRNQLASC